MRAALCPDPSEARVENQMLVLLKIIACVLLAGAFPAAAKYLLQQAAHGVSAVLTGASPICCGPRRQDAGGN